MSNDRQELPQPFNQRPLLTHDKYKLRKAGPASSKNV
jgi:hypothetical protein